LPTEKIILTDDLCPQASGHELKNWRAFIGRRDRRCSGNKPSELKEALDQQKFRKLTWWPSAAGVSSKLKAKELQTLIMNGNPEGAEFGDDWKKVLR
jgi:hypothetical protein